MFNNSELQEYISDVLGKTRGSSVRGDLIAASAPKLGGFCALFTKFINQEVIITLPEKWMSEETKWSINKLIFDCQYEQHGTSNTNNVAWIALNWTQKEVNGIFGEIVLEYQEYMKRYMIGTGGGPGAPKNFPHEKLGMRAMFCYTLKRHPIYILLWYLG